MEQNGTLWNSLERFGTLWNTSRGEHMKNEQEQNTQELEQAEKVTPSAIYNNRIYEIIGMEPALTVTFEFGNGRVKPYGLA